MILERECEENLRCIRKGNITSPSNQTSESESCKSVGEHSLDNALLCRCWCVPCSCRIVTHLSSGGVAFLLFGKGVEIMIGIRGVTRFTSRMATTMMRPLSSSSSAILFHDVTAANADGIVANKISFKLEKGDRVALTGPNQEGKN